MAQTPTRPAKPRPGHVLGTLSARYETSGRGPGTVSTGRGDAGGVSYGSYQLASKLGRPEEFLAREGAGWAAEFGRAKSGMPAFSRVWKAIAAREPEAFHAAQHAFIKRTHYDVQIAHVLKATGVNLDRWSDAVRDAVWSTAVQHGPANTLVIRAMKGDPPHDRALLIALYAERGRRKADGNLAYFSRNSLAVQAGVAQRFRAELKDALAMLSAASA
jgi:hypothetical protein